MSITKEEVAEAVRDWCAANNARDVEHVAAMDVPGIGFGYRTADCRDLRAVGEAGYARLLQQFFDRLASYRLDLEELHTAVADDVGLAWGFYVEEFQEKGLPPERARVRFSQVLRRGENGWKILFFHRDIQPFDPDGRYPRSLTAVE